MRNTLHYLRLLGFVLFLCHRWLEVLYWPCIALIGITTLGLLYYWKENSKTDNYWNIFIVIIVLLVALGL
ncbi:MAG: hypothetical protein J6Y39_04145 [Bacteroidaceae bacterium]|nr:hypothetical protein [Bacteroidaceae bacterium]